MWNDEQNIVVVSKLIVGARFEVNFEFLLLVQMVFELIFLETWEIDF